MFQKLSGSSGNTVGYKAVGKLTEEDYSMVGSELDRLVEETGKVRVLIDLQDFEGAEAGAIKADFQVGMKHRNDIEKLAVVGDEKWQEWMTLLAQPIMGGEVKYFDSSRMPEAWDWLRNAGE